MHLFLPNLMFVMLLFTMNRQSKYFIGYLSKINFNFIHLLLFIIKRCQISTLHRWYGDRPVRKYRQDRDQCPGQNPFDRH